MRSILSALRHPLRSLRKCTDSRTIAFVHLIGKPGTAELCQSASCGCRTTPLKDATVTREKWLAWRENSPYFGARLPNSEANPVSEEGGVKHDQGKLRYDLIPWEHEEGL